VLLAKLQERRGGNQQVKLISAKPCREDPIVAIIIRGGVVTGEDRVTPGKTTKYSRVRRVVEKTQVFDPREEKQTFEERRREFGRY
jgi:hypothetical protein